MIPAPPPPPTNAEALLAAEFALDPIAQLLESEPVLSRTCPRKGRQSRVCIGRIKDRKGQRYRIVVTGQRDSIIVTARPAPRKGS